MSEYRWRCDTSYEVLLAPDGSEVAMLTEPGDRTPFRDLGPITAELNERVARVAELEAALLELHLANRDVFHITVRRYEGSTVEGLYAAEGHKAAARVALAIEALLALGREIAERRKG